MRDTHTITTEGVPQADSTAWAVDPSTGLYVLVLEDRGGNPIGFAAYSFEKWLVCFDRLISIKAREEE